MIVGDFLETNGLIEDNSQLINEMKAIIEDKVRTDMAESGLDVSEFNFEHVVKQSYRNAHGISNIRKSDDDIPCFSVGYKATKIMSVEERSEYNETRRKQFMQEIEDNKV